MSKIVVEPSADSSLYVITTTSDKGAVKQESVKAEPIMAVGQMARVLSTAVKAHGAYRNAALTFLGLVYTQQCLNGFAASADKATGKVSSEFKAAVRDAETATVKQLVTDGVLKLKDEPAIQEFLSVLRDDKNYSNAKVTTNRYFGIVGSNCVTQSGYVVPVPVMQAHIRDALPVEQKDDSIAGMLRAIAEKMDKITIGTDDAIDSLSLANALRSTLEGIVNYNNEVATKQHSDGANVVTASTQALKAAMEKPIGQPVAA